MATLPGQNLNILDPGLGTVGQTLRNVLVFGTCSDGDVNTLRSFSKKQDMVDEFGQGPGPEDACRILDIDGGPVYFMKLNGSVAGASSAVTPTRVSTSTGTVAVTVGVAFDSYRVIVEITKTGGVGVGEFKYSLDFTTNAEDATANNNGRTFSGELVIPSGGAFVIPDTGLTITFADNAGPILFEDGDIHRFDCTAPLYSTTDLANAVTALLLTTTDLATVVLSGEHATAAASATMFAALSTHMVSLQSQFRFVRAIMDGGSLEDNRSTAITAHASSQSTRISLCYGYADITSSKPIVGWGTPQRSYVGLVASRVASDKISTDSARVASGSIPGVVAIRTDEERSPLLNPANFTTMRTFQGEPGFYITQNNLRSPSGSDFRNWQHGAVMDVASATVIKAQQKFIKRSVRTNDSGSINNTDALQMEKDVQSALRAALSDPKNEDGTKGHISDFGYAIDRENDILASETLITTTKIRPLGYPAIIETEIGFSKAVG